MSVGPPTNEYGDPTTGAIPLVTTIAVVLLLAGIPVLGVAVHRIASRADHVALARSPARPALAGPVPSGPVRSIEP